MSQQLKGNPMKKPMPKKKPMKSAEGKMSNKDRFLAMIEKKKKKPAKK